MWRRLSLRKPIGYLRSMAEDRYEKARQRLLAEIELNARDTERWTGRRRFADRVMAAIRAVPRHAFMPDGYEVAAYVNRPQPIGHGQTISQPYIVALMTDLLDLEGTERVLEVGAGSGYQAAVLAETVARVYSLEVVPELAERARERLAGLGYANVEVKVGDGWAGWPEKAPFDAVMVTAAAAHMPDALVGQLKPGGRMVIPIGRPYASQMLKLVTKDAAGDVAVEDVLPVAFVPMVEPPTG